LNEFEIDAMIEAILFASGDPISIDRISLSADLDESIVRESINRLQQVYNFQRRGIRIVQLENSYQMCTAPEHADPVRRALEIRKAQPLSQPALEVLAIIAYYQPVTRAYIEQVRGIDSSYTVSLLAEKGLIEECGRLDAPGKPVLFKTTAGFLRAFGISALNELPKIDDQDNQLQLSMEDALKASQQTSDEVL